MGFGDITKTNKTGGFGKKSSSGGSPLNTIQGLLDTAKGAGLEKEAGKIVEKGRLSPLQRISEGLGAFNPAEAILTGVENKSVGAGIKKYAKGIGTGIAEAVTGKDIDPTERRMFKDVAEELGIHNVILKNGIGFIGDVLLDPSTYFGGAIAKGALAGVKGGAKLALRGAGKISPDIEAGVRLAHKGVKEAVGKTFQYGYGTSKGLPEKALTVQSKLARAKEGIVASNIARLGTGSLSKGQQEELVQKLLAGKRAELGARQAGEQSFEKTGSKGFKTANEPILTEIAIREEMLRNNPAKGLLKYANKKAGELPEVTGQGKGIFRNKGDQIVTEKGFEDSEKAREGYQSYTKEANKIKELKSELVNKRKMFKDEEALNDFLSKDEATKLSAKDIAKQVAQSSDPLIQQKIIEQSTRSKKFAKQAGIADPYEIYFPGLKNDSLKGFIEGTKSMRVGSEGYIKQFKNLLKDEDLIRNPAEAFATREFDVAKDSIIRSQLKSIVGEFGKPLKAFKSEQEAAKAGYKLMKEKGVFGKELGYISDVDKKFIDNLISPEFTTVDMLAKSTGYDALTSLFKRSVTGLFAPFHVRNFVSGHVQNFEVLGIDALNPKNISAGQKMAYKLATGDKKIFDGPFGKAMRSFDDRFGSSSQYISDIADATKGAGNIPGKILSKASFKETAKTAGLGQQSIPFRVARGVGNYIETQQKATAYLTALSQGKTIKESLDLAARAGFDYRALTPFESKIMRRVIPFYSFTRKNIELQMKTLGENPQRINQVLRLVDNLGEKPSAEEKKGLPSYITEGLPVKTGTSVSGKPEYAYSFGTPIEAFAQLFGTADKDFITRQLNTMNNIIKVPLERAVGKAFFENRPLNDVIDAKNYKNMPDFVKNFLKLKEVKGVNKDGEETIKYNADPKRLQLLKALPTSRGVSYLATIFNKDLSKTTKVLYALTGVKPTAVDLETVAYFKDKDQQRALEDLLQRSGVIKQFESNYIPKGKKSGGFGGVKSP